MIAAQDDVGGLYVRPPVAGEQRQAQLAARARARPGMYENEEPWTFVKPVPQVLTVFPGDILQFMTGGYLLSTPHKVRLAARERYALAYFHEPNFEACARPLFDPASERAHPLRHATSPTCSCAATPSASPPAASRPRAGWNGWGPNVCCARPEELEAVSNSGEKPQGASQPR